MSMVVEVGLFAVGIISKQPLAFNPSRQTSDLIVQPERLDVAISPPNTPGDVEILTLNISALPNISATNVSTHISTLNLVEDLFTKHSVMDDATKIKHCRRYADTVSDNEWGAFTQDSYDAFKRELLASYPEPELLREGSLRTLMKICNEYRGITAEDRKEVIDF
ncbi:hypothetical protein C8J56DRAFT_1054732 [Mycena floridula]|nr:hypothetical protein C8J56DRAFT_1054732 [Mycena floridula]